MQHKNLLPSFIFSLILLFSFSSSALADSKLIGKWQGSQVKLNLKADNTYSYQLKGLKFSGKWSAASNVLTLNYKIMGVGKSRKSSYSFKGADLVLTSKKGNVTLKKQ